jgi:hypothetical protein
MISGKAFMNGGGALIEKKRVSLSRVFKWCGKDFGRTAADCMQFLSPYLYDPGDRMFLGEYADRVTVGYQNYDWRLNCS